MIGELLIRQGTISEQQLQEALEYQSGHKTKLGSLLVLMGYSTEEEIANALSRQYGVPALDPRFLEINPTVAELIPPDVARKHEVIPLSRIGSILTVVMTDPGNVRAVDEIRFITGYHVEVLVALEHSIHEVLLTLYPEEPEVEVTFIEEPDLDLKMNLSIAPVKPLHETAAPVIQDCVEQARHIPRRKPDQTYYCGTTSGDIVFDEEAKRLIQQAMKRYK